MTSIADLRRRISEAIAVDHEVSFHSTGDWKDAFEKYFPGGKVPKGSKKGVNVRADDGWMILHLDDGKGDPAAVMFLTSVVGRLASKPHSIGMVESFRKGSGYLLYKHVLDQGVTLVANSHTKASQAVWARFAQSPGYAVWMVGKMGKTRDFLRRATVADGRLSFKGIKDPYNNSIGGTLFLGTEASMKASQQMVDEREGMIKKDRADWKPTEWQSQVIAELLKTRRWANDAGGPVRTHYPLSMTEPTPNGGFRVFPAHRDVHRDFTPDVPPKRAAAEMNSYALSSVGLDAEPYPYRPKAKG